MDTLKQLIDYYQTNGSYVMEEFWRHFLMSAYGVIFAAIIAIPLGVYIARKKRLAGWVIQIANIIQTIPALAMLSRTYAYNGLRDEYSRLILIPIFFTTNSKKHLYGH